MADHPLEIHVNYSDQIERDLCNLAADRISEALHSVLQLADDPKVKFKIAAFAAGTSIGATAGVFAAAYGLEKEEGLDLELAIQIVTACVELRKERSAGGAEPEKFDG